jgi:hypothetical protein
MGWEWVGGYIYSDFSTGFLCVVLNSLLATIWVSLGIACGKVL